MSFMYACFGVGAMISPLVIGGFVDKGIDWNVCYVYLFLSPAIVRLRLVVETNDLRFVYNLVILLDSLRHRNSSNLFCVLHIRKL